MAKDYAKNVFAHTRKSVRTKQKSELFWVIGLLIVLAVMIGLFVLHNRGQAQDPVFAKNNLTAWAQHFKALFKHDSNATLKKEPQNTAAQTSQDQDVHFDFYNELPNIKVGALVKEDVAAQQAAKTQPATQQVNNATKAVTATADAAVKKYYLQLGSFKQQSEASQFRLSLLLAGIDATIVKVVDSYQVQQGPFASNVQAKAAQHRLERKGFSGEIKKID